MPTQRLVGSRIREKRLDLGLKQAAVAEAVDISPSYLNLIEHNRRRIGGKLIADLARVLNVDTALLAEGANVEILDKMRSAAASIDADVELSRAEEMAARYPGWSGLIASQAARIEALEEQVRVLTDRMAYDPQLSGALHEVISAVSAIRSSASILVGPEDLDADWQRRFHTNIHNDSVRLAESSEALIDYLEAPDAGMEHASSPFEQVETYLAQSGFHLAALEDKNANLSDFVDQSGLSGAAQQILGDVAVQYRDDAEALPIGQFEGACEKLGYDPVRLAEKFDVPISQAMRRLAQLPSGNRHPPIGLASCDGSGAITFMKPVPGFSIPRFGGACPVWPLFGALSRPLQPIRQEVILPGPSSTRLLCYAIAELRGPARFNRALNLQSTMLVMPDVAETTGEQLSVGVSCRICPVAECASRREPAMMVS